jgi:hypothetical protein
MLLVNPVVCISRHLVLTSHTPPLSLGFASKPLSIHTLIALGYFQTISRVDPYIVGDFKPRNGIHYPGDEVSVTFNNPVCVVISEYLEFSISVGV